MQRWEENFNKVRDFAEEHKGEYPYTDSPEPTKADDKVLARWMSTCRTHLKTDIRSENTIVYDRAVERVWKFKEIGINILRPKPFPRSGHKLHPKNLRNWKQFIDDYKPVFDDKAELEKLEKYLNAFRKRPPGNFVSEYKSIVDYVLTGFKVGDLPPWDCKPECDVWTMKFMLSFIAYPETLEECLKGPSVEPKERHPDTQESCVFDPKCVLEHPVIGPLISKLQEEILPSWLPEMYDDNKEGKIQKYTVEELIEYIDSCPDWFSPHLVSKLGHNPKAGTEILTQSKKPCPRRQTMSAEITGPEENLKQNCHTEGVYSYNCNHTPLPWLGVTSQGRNI
jgi:hypothetical protein